MKKTSKILALVLVVAMIVAMGVGTVAFAATITVQNVIDDETYTAYKILNYRDNGATGDDRKVSYYLTAAEYASIGGVLEDAGFSFTASSDGTEYFVDNAATFDAAAAAAALAGSLEDLGSALGSYEATGANGSADFENLPTGYFFVTSTAGSLCALHEDTDIATLVEKNTIPSVDKTESTDNEDFVNGPVDANIGDTVYYQIVVTDGVGTDADITIKDTMSRGLTYSTGTIAINGASVDDDDVTDNWTVSVNGQVITIVFDAGYVASLDKDDEIVITYQAVINENAVIDSATGNENKVELDYSEQHSEDKVYVETYDFQVTKVDGDGAFLDGAEFKLYDAATGGTQILLSQDGTGYYVDAAGDPDDTIDIDSAAGCNVRGLAPGDYYLEEVVVPDGYNKLDGRTKVTVVTNGTAAVEIEVENQAGAELPSTGGIGTTIFYVVGAILVVGAVVILVTRRRMSATK